MLRLTMFRLLIAALAIMALGLTGAPAARANPPSNDNFADAAIISSLPFAILADTTEATFESGEPQICGISQQTVWYAFTPAAPATAEIEVGDPFNPFGDTANIYRAAGPGIGGLSPITCATLGTMGSFPVEAGATYYIQLARAAGGGGVRFILSARPPLPGDVPPNDDFASAAPIAGVPYEAVAVNMAHATLESDEPAPACGTSFAGSIWYRFEPAQNTVAIPLGGPPVVIALYAGTSLAALRQLSCQAGPPKPMFFEAETTYYLQVGVSSVDPDNPLLQFRLDIPPQPVASFWSRPYEPSSFDTVQLYDNSYDPGFVGIQSQAWSFGDGVSATGSHAAHQYRTDGDYTVALTITTHDGRTASAAQLIKVRTHDIAIARVVAPHSARAGETRQISVDIRSARAAENVEIKLYRSTAAGDTLVGSQTQPVPAPLNQRTSRFSFDYSFTSEDAIAGKLTFKAAITIVGFRDARPQDNQATARPTRVRR